LSPSVLGCTPSQKGHDPAISTCDHKERVMKSVKIKQIYWDIAADLYFPPDFDESKKYPVIISVHPIGSCKEQCSGNVYGKALAKAGFVVIAFDASFQDVSGGEPRFIEDPTLRVEDFRVACDYLVTLPYVDEKRIGVLGICGGGGYSINAAMTERRIKAVGTVTGANYGRLMREGFSGFDPIGALEAMAKQRTAEARGAALRVAVWTICCRLRPRLRRKRVSRKSMYSAPLTTTAPTAAMRLTA